MDRDIQIDFFKNKIIMGIEDEDLREEIFINQTYVSGAEYYWNINITIKEGISKKVFIPEGGYVYKVPLRGDYSSCCMVEAVIYTAAKAEGLEKYFASTEYLYCEEGLSEPIDIYISERVYASSNMVFARADSLKNKDKIATITPKMFESPLLERSTDVGRLFLDDYGFEEFQKLTSFLQKWNVNDLHPDNVGFKDNKIVLIDYSGAHSDSDSDEY